MKLEDLVPEGSEFFLALPNRSFHLRPCVLSDEIWLQKTFGAELVAILSEMRVVELCKIAVRFMEPEDQQFFKLRQVTFVSEETGEELTRSLGGYECLMTLVSGLKEKQAICQAIFSTIGLNRPTLEKMEDEEKKSQQSTIGGPSSTLSAPNTDGQPSTF